MKMSDGFGWILMESLQFSLQVQTGSVWQFGAFNGQLIPFRRDSSSLAPEAFSPAPLCWCSACPLGQVFEDAWPQMKLE
jgi:hypothetical protein